MLAAGLGWGAVFAVLLTTVGAAVERDGFAVGLRAVDDGDGVDR